MSAVNIIKSLKLQKEIDNYIISTDIDKYAPGLHLADKYYISPPIKMKKEYIDFLFDLVKKYKISAIFPCFSNEISIISEYSQDFHKLGAQTLLPHIDIINLCNDKLRSSEFVKSLQIPIPKILNNPTKADLPIFTKMLSGSSSSGAFLIKDKFQLKSFMLDNRMRLYQEYIDGIEYTVDILCDRKSNVLVASPRKRLSIKSGQTVKGVTVCNDKICEYVKVICKKLGIIGVCNIQFIEQNGKYYFIEINPRYAAGGLMLTVKSGSNIPLLALKTMLNIPINNNELETLPNVTMTRYWEEIILGDKN